ncbi:hypothetical protein MCP1_290033 [Candidatus Terasakiella magnetica]|nr:hypothetical protein MCP1_290033 [Candidatus Terasakiella magnetica]
MSGCSNAAPARAPERLIDGGHAMAKKTSFDPDKVQEIDGGMAFVQLPLDLITSSAWQGQSINCRRLIDFLMAEHLRHGRLENSRLFAPYDELEGAGIGRRFIAKIIIEAEKRGLVEAIRGARSARNKFYPTRFRLTFFRTIGIDSRGQTYYSAPTHEWRQYQPTAEKNDSRCYKGEPDQCTFVNSTSAPSSTRDVEKMVEISHSAPSANLSKGAPLCISRVGRGATSIDGAATGNAEYPTTQAITLPSPADLDQTSNRQAGRQHHGQDEHNSEAPSLLDFIDAQNENAVAATINPSSPADRLRDSAKAKLATSERGTQKALALLIGVSPSHLSNFLGGRFSLTNGAVAMLQDWLDGRKVIASPKEAAA